MLIGSSHELVQHTTVHVRSCKPNLGIKRKLCRFVIVVVEYSVSFCHTAQLASRALKEQRANFSPWLQLPLTSSSFVLLAGVA